MTTPAQSLHHAADDIDATLQSLANDAVDLQKQVNVLRGRMDAYENASEPPNTDNQPSDPGTAPQPAPDTEGGAGDRSFGCNVGFYQHKDWSPDKPDDPRYAGLLKPVGHTIRTMDWDRVNDYVDESYDEAKLDKQIALAVACDADFYLCLRYYDGLEEITAKVRRIREGIGPDKTLYVEWVNEPWNPAFATYKEIKSITGQDLGGDMFFDLWANRAEHAFMVAKQTDPTCKTVLGCQTANPWVAKQVEKRLDPDVEPDMHGLTWYFGAGIGGTPRPDLDATDILEHADAKLENKEIPRVRDHIAYSKSIGREVIGYEGGSHFTIDPRLHESHKGVWRAMNEANRDPRILELYRDMVAAWKDAGGGPMLHYNFLSIYDKWGSWGLGESLDTITQSTKYRYAAGLE